jgi:xylan 1,4-beta-xylosidase
MTWTPARTGIRAVFCLVYMALAAPPIAGARTIGEAQEPNQIFPPQRIFKYKNPIYPLGKTGVNGDNTLRDPCIIRVRNTYYLVFTMYPFGNWTSRNLSRPNQNSSPGIRIYSSKDLIHWKPGPWLYKSSRLPTSCPYKNQFWAPEIHQINGRFYIIFGASNWIAKKYNPGDRFGYWTYVGVANKVTGPYRHTTLLPGGSGCDSDLFQDTDGKVYDIFPLGNMYVQQIDLSHIKQHKIKLIGPRILAVPSSNKDIGLPVSPGYVEGPWTTRIGSEYYLFYAEPYFKKNPKYPRLYGYWTGCAYARHIMGPWKKDPRGAVFWGGHLSLFKGPDGRPWFGYREEAFRRYWGLLGVDPLIIGPHGRVHTHPTLGVRYVPLPARH